MNVRFPESANRPQTATLGAEQTLPKAELLNDLHDAIVRDASEAGTAGYALCAFNWRWDPGDITSPSTGVFNDDDAARMAAFIESTRN
jgi:hypothetical protein